MLPHGIESIEDIPWDLVRAIEHAHLILGWQENLVSEEIPPRWMWAHDYELKQWFDEIRMAREEKYGGDHDDDGDAGSEMMSNDLANAKR